MDRFTDPQKEMCHHQDLFVLFIIICRINNTNYLSKLKILISNKQWKGL